MAWYYPKGKPVTFSYTKEFVSGEEIKTKSGRMINVHGQLAKKNIEGQKKIAANVITEKGRGGAAIAELNRMISMARKAEQRFLTSHKFKNPGDNWNKLITDINKVLSTEEAFKRNVQLLKQFNEGDMKTYEDVSSYFHKYLRSAIYDNLVVDVNATGADILFNSVQKAIKTMSEITETKESDKTIKKLRTSDENKKLQAFSELFGVIKIIKGSSFLTEINNLFGLEDYIEQARQGIINQKINKRSEMPTLKYKSGKGGKGTLAEILYTMVEQGLGSRKNSSIEWHTVEHTGLANYKPDRVLATGVISYNQAVQKVKDNDVNYNGSVRARGIATMEQFYDDLKDAESDIVLISDKNYLINKLFTEGNEKKLGGFVAQGETSLNALEGLLNSLHINIFDIDALINYLANVGSNLVETDIDNRILRAISTQIGNFLFDDLSFDESIIPNGINVIHVFQLSGIYVPLSIILEGVKRGVGNIGNTDLSSYVEVDFKASSDIPDSWSKDDGEEVFIDFRNTKMKNNTLSVNFLRSFASVISENVKL